MRLTINKNIVLFSFLVGIASIFLGGKPMAEDLTSVEVSLETSTEAEFIDFLYKYSKEK